MQAALSMAICKGHAPCEFHACIVDSFNICYTKYIGTGASNGSAVFARPCRTRRFAQKKRIKRLSEQTKCRIVSITAPECNSSGYYFTKGLKQPGNQEKKNMPKKYTATSDDLFALSGISTIYSMINPIERKLVAAGYQGPILADYDNLIYEGLKVIDQEATRKLQEQKNQEWEAANRRLRKQNKPLIEHPVKVDGVCKQTEDNYMTKGNTFQLASHGTVNIVSNSLTDSKDYTEESANRFHKYLDKVDKYIDLLISNTPEEEFKEEFTQLRFQKAHIRTIKTFGSRTVFSNELSFASCATGIDGEMPLIKEPGVCEEGVSRELWKQVNKNYPYNDLLAASTDIMNTACDYEENKEKNTYIEQIKYRDNYRKAVKSLLDTSRSLANGAETTEKIIKQHLKETVIKELKEADGPDKNIDYNEIMKRVEEQKKNR